MLRLLPLSLPERQRLIAGAITVTPEPDELSTFNDFFRHPTSHAILRGPHEKLDIRMQARVMVQAQPMTADFSPLLDRLPQEIGETWSLDAESPHHFLGTSPRLPRDKAIAAYVRSMLKPSMTVRQIAETLCSRIHKDFTYDAEATTVDTTPAEAFDKKRGVCQDFSHVMIVALRSLGIPAGYVSGFLRTIPPPGKERLEGADAMHAWVRYWCGRVNGWMELDPTNNIPAGTDHIVVGYGRDYADVAPVIGVLKGYGQHKTSQAVDVIPVRQTA
jgi:transglutaminase-like putative cysteine protease